MTNDDTKNPDARTAPMLPLRFGIRDGVAAMFLFAAQLTLFNKVVTEHVRYESNSGHVLAAAVLSAALTFGAAYLSARFATRRRIENFGIRIGLLVLFDVLLMSSPVVVIVLIAAWPLTLLVLIFWRMERNRQRLAQLKQLSDDSTELKR